MIQDGVQFVKKNDLPTIWAAFVSHDAHPLLQFVKYGVCGVMAVVVHNAIFYALAYTRFPAIEGMTIGDQPLSDGLRARNVVICNSVGFAFANVVAYLTNVLWVFRSGRHHRVLEFVLFTLVALIGFVAGLAGGPLLIKLFGISTHIAQFLFVFTSVVVNYLSRKFLIFKR